MNAVELALLELRADMARNPGGPDNAELGTLLDGAVADSDADLKAAAALLDFSIEDLEERAAIIEFDAGTSRVTANRLALTYALQQRHPGVSDAACRWFAHHSADVMAFGHKHGMDLDVIRKQLRGYVRRRVARGAASNFPFAAVV